MQKQQIIDLVCNKETKFLAKVLYGYTPTDKQKEIIDVITYGEHKRVAISCMTRYGKSWNASAGIANYILLNRNKSIRLIGPTYNQTGILRNYITSNIANTPILYDLLKSSDEEQDKLRRQVSRSRMTFRNGCELMILSAEGQGERLLGFGGDLIVVDESVLVDHEVYRAKISRMLGDSADAAYVELFNPWHRNNHAYEHWEDDNFKKIHVGYKDALKEGRITQSFVDEQKRILTPIEFEVLYESVFPSQGSCSLLSVHDIEQAINRKFHLQKGLRIISCDPADEGLDYSVVMVGRCDRGMYEINEIYSEAKSDQMKLAEKIYGLALHNITDYIFIDYGMGVGVISRLNQLFKNHPCKVVACYNAKKARDKKRFLNKKAEQHFELAKLFEQGKISIPKNTTLKNEAIQCTYEIQKNNDKIKILKPEKSPDFLDSLIYFVWPIPNASFSIR